MARRHGGSVLIVDDSADHLLLASRRLRDAGWSVQVAASAEEALGALEHIDLVLVDYQLPGLSGLELLQEIRRRGGPSVVMVTGMGSEGLAVEAMRLGALDYITKDATYLEDLPHKVARSWRHHDLHRRAAELQRLALLVTAPGEREEVLAAIAEGARDVLRADACVLLILDDDLRVGAAAGDSTLAAIDLRREAQEELRVPTRPAMGATDRLLIPIRASDGSPLGVLAVLTAHAVAYDGDELELASTFAAFAGIALANLRRLQLERRLVTELERALDARRDFLAHVSHELRTPLTCVEGFAHTLLYHWRTLDDEDRELFLTKISDHGRDLHQLVEGLLDYASVESGRTRDEPCQVALDAALREITVGLEPLVAGHQIEVECDAVEVMVDPTLLRRIVTNLVANAAKYSPPSATIRIRGTLASPSAALLEVIDAGLGIRREDLEHVFEPFWRGPGVLHGTVRGTGLGLALVREYTRLLGGDVGVDSSPGDGSRFWLTLPLAG